jgi:hypothetical protein
MRASRSNWSHAVAWLTACSVAAGQGGTLALAQAAGAGSAAVADGGWPRQYPAADGSHLTVYEPQVSNWEQQKRLTLHTALAYTPPGGDRPLLGTAVVEANSRVSVEHRLVDFSGFTILSSNFPQASREQAAAAVAALKTAMPVRERVLALERVLAAIDASTIRPQSAAGVKSDPPVIFSSTRPAVIVNIDGAPIWSPIQSNELRFAVNTNWDLFEHPSSTQFYLRHERTWLTARTITGPWTVAATLPPSFSRLPADDNWKEVRAALPPTAAAFVPRVMVSTSPAELILLRGEPQYEPVGATSLLWVRNTDADLFRLGKAGSFYFLVAGRWFSAPSLDGPWTFATPTLPDEFSRIPLEHERSRVLASVPGTVQAAEAVLLAQVPQTARVNKKSIAAPDVAYAGEPSFERIEPTTVSRATNTDKDIIKVGDLYYMCFQGVWFMGRTPTGPWEVTGSVPGEIYEIPISSPAHAVTYVTVEDDDDDWVVYAAAAGYTGMMVAWGCAMWGTGWYYPPGVWYGGFYPAYFPHYPTYGYGAWYNPWTGGYGRAAGVYGPYGGAGVAARYNPRTGTYARGAVAYGPYGSRGAAHAYNPRTGASAATRQGSSIYGSWGATGVQRGDQWASTARVTNRATGTTTRATGTSGGGAAVSRRGPQGSGFVGTSGSGNVYAGQDGNVYRKQGDGWQKYDNGAWGDVNTPATRDAGAGVSDRTAPDRGSQARTDAATVGQLDRSHAARSEGSQRTSDAATVRSGSAGSRSGSYRPSGGGGMRGGGRRR